MKAYVSIEAKEVIGGKLFLQVDITITSDTFFVAANGKPQSIGGNIPRQSIPLDSAANLINALEARAIAVGAGLGHTLVAADCVISGIVQGA